MTTKPIRNLSIFITIDNQCIEEYENETKQNCRSNDYHLNFHMNKKITNSIIKIKWILVSIWVCTVLILLYYWNHVFFWLWVFNCFWVGVYVMYACENISGLDESDADFLSNMYMNICNNVHENCHNMLYIYGPNEASINAIVEVIKNKGILRYQYFSSEEGGMKNSSRKDYGKVFLKKNTTDKQQEDDEKFFRIPHSQMRVKIIK